MAFCGEADDAKMFNISLNGIATRTCFLFSLLTNGTVQNCFIFEKTPQPRA
jgi:hypothetical protein